MWLKRLQYAYITGLALWPGLAVLGLQFVPASQEVWVARLPGTLIFLGCLVLLAAVAIYLSFITEVLPFPARWPEAILTTMLLPAYLLLSLVTTPQSIWEVVVSGYLVECGILLATIVVLVVQKVSRRHWNTFAIVVLLGTAGLMLSAMIPLFIRMADQSGLVYLWAIGAVVSGTIQNARYYHAPARPKLPAELFILIGIVALIILPFAGALVRSL